MAVLAVTINGEPWSETKDLTQSGPDDRHYVVDRESGRIFFGDGEHGAVPPAGATFGLRLTDGFYELDVPHGGAVTITTQLGSHDEPSQGGGRAKKLGCVTAIAGAVAGLFAWRSRR